MTDRERVATVGGAVLVVAASDVSFSSSSGRGKRSSKSSKHKGAKDTLIEEETTLGNDQPSPRTRQIMKQGNQARTRADSFGAVVRRRSMQPMTAEDMERFRAAAATADGAGQSQVHEGGGQQQFTLVPPRTPGMTPRPSLDTVKRSKHRRSQTHSRLAERARAREPGTAHGG